MFAAEELKNLVNLIKLSPPDLMVVSMEGMQFPTWRLLLAMHSRACWEIRFQLYDPPLLYLGRKSNSEAPKIAWYDMWTQRALTGKVINRNFIWRIVYFKFYIYAIHAENPLFPPEFNSV